MTAVGGDTGRRTATAERARPLFDGQAGADGEIDFARIRRLPEFQALRRRRRRFVVPVSMLFMAWFMVYVLLSAYDHAFMARQVLGLINIGIMMGLAQFLTTILIMTWYCWYADRRLDPLVDEVRARAGGRS